MELLVKQPMVGEQPPVLELGPAEPAVEQPPVAEQPPAETEQERPNSWFRTPLARKIAVGASIVAAAIGGLPAVAAAHILKPKPLSVAKPRSATPGSTVKIVLSQHGPATKTTIDLLSTTPKGSRLLRPGTTRWHKGPKGRPEWSLGKLGKNKTGRISINEALPKKLKSGNFCIYLGEKVVAKARIKEKVCVPVAPKHRATPARRTPPGGIPYIPNNKFGFNPNGGNLTNTANACFNEEMNNTQTPFWYFDQNDPASPIYVIPQFDASTPLWLAPGTCTSYFKRTVEYSLTKETQDGTGMVPETATQVYASDDAQPAGVIPIKVPELPTYSGCLNNGERPLRQAKLRVVVKGQQGLDSYYRTETLNIDPFPSSENACSDNAPEANKFPETNTQPELLKP